MDASSANCYYMFTVSFQFKINTAFSPIVNILNMFDEA